MSQKLRILANFLSLYFKYITDNYQYNSAQLNKLLEELIPGRTLSFYQNERNYITFEESLLITEKLIELTNDPNLPYKVGRANFKYLDANFALFNYVKYFASSDQILEKICTASNIGNGYITAQHIKSGNGSGEFIFTFKENLLDLNDPKILRHCDEIVQNMKGLFEAVSDFRFGKPAIVDITETKEKKSQYKFRIINQHSKEKILISTFRDFIFCLIILSPTLYFNFVNFYIYFLAGAGALTIYKTSNSFYLMKKYLNKYKKEELDHILAKETVREKEHDEENNIEFSANLNKIETFNELLDFSTQTMVDNFKLERAALIILDFESNTLKIKSVFPKNSIDINLINKFELPLQIDDPDESKLSNVIAKKKNILIADTKQYISSLNDPVSKKILSSLNSKSLGIIPLVSEKKVYGAFLTDNTRYKMEDKLMARLETPCNIIASNLKKIQVVEQSKKFVPTRALELIGVDELISASTKNNSRVNIGLFFSDIIGYTKMTQELSDDMEVHNLINEYYNYLQPSISNNSGYVDNYMGDAIFAIFPELDDMISAVIDFKQKLFFFNSNRYSLGKHLLETRIGLAYGDVVLGLRGSNKRMLVSGTGDYINIASKIEAIGKELFSTLTITEEVANNIITNKNIVVKPLGQYNVGGRNGYTKLFELLVKPNLKKIGKTEYTIAKTKEFNEKTKNIYEIKKFFELMENNKLTLPWDYFRQHYDKFCNEKSLILYMRRNLCQNRINFSEYLLKDVLTKSYSEINELYQNKLCYLMDNEEKGLFDQFVDLTKTG